MIAGPRPKLILAVLALAFSGLAHAQEPVPLGAPGTPASAFPAPDRPVAGIISPIWSHAEPRDAADETGQIVRLLGIAPGMTVADLGAGSGYHAVRLSPVVGPSGRVIAQDIMPEYLRDLAAQLRERGLSNVTPALGEAHDPRLGPASADVAILVHMYHEIEQPYAFLHNLAPALKPGARVGVVDLARPIAEHGTPPDLLRCELAAVGYRQTGFSELTGDVGYLAIFEPPAAGALPAPSAIKACRSS